MHQPKTIVMGTISGFIVGLLSAAVFVASASLLAGIAGLTGIVTLFGMANGAVVGGINGLRGFLTRGERWALGVALSMATAALTVLIGQFAAGSLTPLAIYGLGLLNAVLIAFVASRRGLIVKW